ncbi:MAG: GrpB family protein [Bacillota bacterium]|nr:GrpB family protein [Bacillota bacterium]
MTEDLTIDELWKTYPIEILGPNPDWQNIYEEERDRIRQAFGSRDFKIYHVGSTAVPNLKARDIIDILIEVAEGEDMNFLAFLLVKNGYKKMVVEKNRISLNKGYSPEPSQEQIYHIHLRRPGDLREIYFRNALRKNPKLSKTYESLKLKLAKDFRDNRQDYLLGKSDFINKYTQMEEENFR